MKQKLIIYLVVISTFFQCNLGKDKSNDPMELLARLLVRLLLNGSAINPELPSNVSVAVPRSIRKSDSGLSFSSKLKNTKDLNSLLSTGSTGIGILQEGTSIISTILQDSKRDLVLISPIYIEAKANPGVCIPGGKSKTTIGQSAIDEMVEGLVRLGLSQTEAEAELASLQGQGVLPKIGQSIPTPALVYRPSREKPYDHEVNFSFSDSISVPKTCPNNINSKTAFEKTIRWKNDKSQIFSFIQKNIKIFNISITINASLTYFTSSGKKDRSILNTKLVTNLGNNNTNEVTKTLTVEECNQDTDANTTNCVSLNFKSREKPSSNLTIDTNIKGRTDNEGGRAYTTINKTGAGATAPFVIEIYESYDPDGTITWIEYYEDDVYTDGFGDDDGDYFFDENDLFDGFVELKLDLGCSDTGAANCTGEQLPTDYRDFDVFVIVYSGDNPNTDEDLILGYGVFEDDGTATLGYDKLSEVEIIYFGEEEDVPSLAVWRLDFDNDDNVHYVKMDNDTLSIL